MIRGVLSRLHRAFGASAIATKAAVLLRNQCQCVIGYHLGDNPDPRANGENLLLKMVAPTATAFVDVGANVGDWSTCFIEHMPPHCKGLLFEPSSSAYGKLIKELKGIQGVEVVNTAVSDSVGEEVAFWEEPCCGVTSSLVPGFSSSTSVKTFVRSTTLDHEFAARRWSHVSFVKIDAEGFDLHVLRGATRSLHERLIDVVQFEYNAPWAATGSTLSEARQLLTQSGYRLYLLKPSGLYTLDYDRYREYYRYSNYVALSPASVSRFKHLMRGVI